MKLAKTFLCIVIGIFIPLVVSALLLLFSSFIWIFLQHYENFVINPDSIFYARTFSLLLLGSVFFSGIQSILYSLIMNLSVLPKMKKTQDVLLVSTILGGLSGTCIFVFNLIFDRSFHFSFTYLYIILLGLAVGTISGYLLLKIRSFLF
ncbi:hypothetical protein ACX1N5_15545 [Acinetobacter sp. ANC 4636]